MWQSHANVSCLGYRDQFEHGLGLLMKCLDGELAKEKQETGRSIETVNVNFSRFSNLLLRAKNLRYVAIYACPHNVGLPLHMEMMDGQCGPPS